MVIYQKNVSVTLDFWFKSSYLRGIGVKWLDKVVSLGSCQVDITPYSKEEGATREVGTICCEKRLFGFSSGKCVHAVINTGALRNCCCIVELGGQNVCA